MAHFRTSTANKHDHLRKIGEIHEGVYAVGVRHRHCQRSSTANRFRRAYRRKPGHVVDNLCDPFGVMAGGAGIQLHAGWIHPLAAGARSDRADN